MHRKTKVSRYLYLYTILSMLSLQVILAQSKKHNSSYFKLVTLFSDWRSFEKAAMVNGAPDYSQVSFERQQPKFNQLQEQLEAIDTSGWSIPEQVDWRLVKAEMNGYDFNQRILKPWQRDPAFYKTLWMDRSDVPAHEGPTHHGVTELWTYSFPLSGSDRSALINNLKVIPPLQQQAKQNLTGNAKELWLAGIRTIANQANELSSILSFEGVATDTTLVNTIKAAIESTNEFVDWLQSESAKKTGPSGIGKENYTWYLQNVHLVPLTWDDEVMILKRELARAWSSLKLEEHRNRALPELVAASSPEDYQLRAKASAASLIEFLKNNAIVDVKDYFVPALEAHLGTFVPEKKRNFFWITAHYDQRPLYSHFYHWFELARMDTEPNTSPIRRQSLLYNIFDSRNEGMATAVEEAFMQAGLYDDNPRVREIVYIMLAQRAARGLGSLYAQDNLMTMEEAGGIHSEYTPRGWMKTEKELLLFEQHLYMRQPGYGTSYITGKYLFEQAMMEVAKMKERQKKPFHVSDFMNALNSIGNIPMSLAIWEMTGRDYISNQVTD